MRPLSLKGLEDDAKINLRLKVMGRRPDGYHDLDMMMVPLTLADLMDLDLRPDGILVDCDHTDLKGQQQNLVVKAVHYAQKYWHFNQGCHVTLKKNIPLAGGLGGGSSDAATTLMGLAQLMGVSIPSGEFARIAHEIGADVPFFLSGGAQMAQGIGEVLSPIKIAFPLPIILINPGIQVSTKEVFGTLKMRLTSPTSDVSLPRSYNRLDDLCAWMENDLEASTCSRYVVIQHLKEALLCHGAKRSLMSGSGATVFGIFKTAEKRDQVFELMKKDFPTFWITKTEMAR